MNWLAGFLIGASIASMFVNAYYIGKERDPYTATSYCFDLVMYGLIICLGVMVLKS